MRRSKAGQIAFASVCIILGIMLASQFKNVQKVGGSVSIQRTQELTNKVDKLSLDNEGLRNQIIQSENKIKDFEAAAQDSGLITKSMVTDLQEAKIEAGLADVAGPGVVITLNHLYYIDQSSSKRVVQQVIDEDLLKIINEMNASGAEAISINGERLIATSEIRNAGDHININTNSYSVPFVIQVIGKSETLMAGLHLNGGVLDILNAYYDIKAVSQENVIIPKYKGVIQFKYAKPMNDNK